MPWQDYLMPVASRTNQVERAVLECLYAGCQSIIIVCDQDVQPLLKIRIGEFAFVPPFPSKVDYIGHYRKAAIYYVSTHNKDIARASYGWSILWGAVAANYICGKISDWLKPRKFYVAFPFGALPLENARKQRHCVLKRQNLFFSYQGKTVKDDEYLSFSFDSYDLVSCIRNIRSIERKWAEEQVKQGKICPSRHLPSKKMKLSQIFGHLNYSTDVIEEVPWYYNLDGWENYCKFLGSEERKTLEHDQHGFLLKGYTWKANKDVFRELTPNEIDEFYKNQDDRLNNDDDEDIDIDEEFDISMIDQDKIDEILKEEKDD